MIHDFTIDSEPGDYDESHQPFCAKRSTVPTSFMVTTAKKDKEEYTECAQQARAIYHSVGPHFLPIAIASNTDDNTGILAASYTPLSDMSTGDSNVSEVSDSDNDVPDGTGSTVYDDTAIYDEYSSMRVRSIQASPEAPDYNTSPTLNLGCIHSGMVTRVGAMTNTDGIKGPTLAVQNGIVLDQANLEGVDDAANAADDNDNDRIDESDQVDPSSTEGTMQHRGRRERARKFVMSNYRQR
jgi:hypothetical protein